MPAYWLDSNIFIEAKNGPYGFEMAPSFWEWIERTADEGRIRSSIQVYEEIAKGTDELAKWAKKMRKAGLFVNPDAAVQKRFGEIAAFVQSRYEPARSAAFLDGADPWVISHAFDDHGTVVTHEIFAEGKKVKIPNVCAHFSVRCMRTYEALRTLGLKL